MYCKSVKVNEEQALTGIVDTGSSVCTVKKSAVAKCGLRTENGMNELFWFGNASTPCVKSKKIAEADIAINNVSMKNVSFVVPDNAQPSDLIIGRSFTENPEVAYAKMNNELYFGERVRYPFSEIRILNTTKSLAALALTENTVPRNSIGLLVLGLLIKRGLCRSRTIRTKMW